jgi:hypothetical protein
MADTMDGLPVFHRTADEVKILMLSGRGAELSLGEMLEYHARAHGNDPSVPGAYPIMADGSRFAFPPEPVLFTWMLTPSPTAAPAA